MATREEFIKGLRDLADYLEQNGLVPVPGTRREISVIPLGTDAEKYAAVDAAAYAMGVDAVMDGDTYECAVQFGPIEYRAFAHTEQHMADWREKLRLGDEALAAKKAAEVVEEFVPEPFVKATPAEVAEAYESSAAASLIHFPGTDAQVIEDERGLDRRSARCGYYAVSMTQTTRRSAVTCEGCRESLNADEPFENRPLLASIREAATS